MIKKVLDFFMRLYYFNHSLKQIEEKDMANISENSLSKKDLVSLEKRLLSKIEEASAKAATKEELKTEVAKLATKEELKAETAKLSTKESVEVVAREVLKHSRDIEGLRTDIAEVKGDVKILKWEMGQLSEKMDTLQENFHIVLNAVDNMSAKFDIFITEKVAIDHALSRQDIKIDNHEVRIQRLEMEIA